MLFGMECEMVGGVVVDDEKCGKETIARRRKERNSCNNKSPIIFTCAYVENVRGMCLCV